MGQSSKRAVKVERTTAETNISAELDLDGSGKIDVKGPVAFMDHMVTALSKHALFDLVLRAEGDVEVDDHHTAEDLGLVLGEAIAKAVGDKRGIRRFGQAHVPMDESLAWAAADFSGRPFLVYNVEIPERARWEFDCNLAREFFQALASAARINLHIKLEYGDNYHHALEAAFKAAGRAIGQAVSLDPRIKGVLSTKDALD